MFTTADVEVQGLVGAALEYRQLQAELEAQGLNIIAIISLIKAVMEVIKLFRGQAK